MDDTTRGCLVDLLLPQELIFWAWLSKNAPAARDAVRVGKSLRIPSQVTAAIDAKGLDITMI